MTEMKKSSPPPNLFSSLPYDVVLNILARISRFHRPTLSLVSRSFRSLIASRELDATRTRIGKTEDCVYVCLDLNQNQRINPRWFALAPTPKQQRSVPIPSFPYVYPKSPTVVSNGSELYIIGGYAKRRTGRRSKSVFLLDCRSHQWSKLKNMRVGRPNPAAEVIDGKIYVIGGCLSNKSEDWGEVYDIKTQTWEPLSPETLALTAQKSVVPGRLVMGGKVYDMNGLELNCRKHIRLVEMDKNVFCQILVSGGKLMWRDAKEDLEWGKVLGLEEMSTNYFVSMSNSCGGTRVIVWWEKDLEIWCAEVSFERYRFEDPWGIWEIEVSHRSEQLWGVVEWSKSVFDDEYDAVFRHSALVTH
ncbi:unnamed protein product [Arabis nemorensis]|uniref:F-box domain-containing protein n=1 Tax=Arabis nemorensis TaxID=586526 RepID=A0A565CH81_9BRAS|nr:unnamed protein product [Arabis nemorensis]